MKFAKASITAQVHRGSSDASAYCQKGRGGDFRFCSRDPDPRSRDGSPEQYDDAAAIRDVTKLCLRNRCSCGGLDFRTWFLWSQKSLPHGNREHL